MVSWIQRRVTRAYEGLLRREIDGVPEHVAIIQDGNRRYARERGSTASAGHRAGAKTTERVLDWCEELDIRELTVYAFSTENFDRPEPERQALFDLLEEKLYEFADADRVQTNEVRIRAVGEVDRLPDRVQRAIRYAEERTAGFDRFRLNVALAYGGRSQLLNVARRVATAVAEGRLEPGGIDVAEINRRFEGRPVRDVDLIVRTGGDERTSNFLPWHANGNEAAVVFCAPYWPTFSKVDFLRAIRTYESREASWQRTRTKRAIALVRAVGRVELDEARRVARRLRAQLPRGGQEILDELERAREPAD